MEVPAEDERDKSTGDRERKETPITKGRGRYGTDENISNNSAAQRRSHTKRNDTHDVEPCIAHRCQCSVQAEDESPDQVKPEQQRRFGAHRTPLVSRRLILASAAAARRVDSTVGKFIAFRVCSVASEFPGPSRSLTGQCLH